jgi:serine/threonine protein kinase
MKILICLSFRLRSINPSLNEGESNHLLINQTLIIIILRLIFSLEKNRKYFKSLLPTKLLGTFIDIGNYKHSLNLYSNFISEFNNLSEDDLNEISQKSELISEDSPMMQTIGGYSVVELIGKGGFGSVFKVKIGNQKFAMKEIKLEISEYKKLNGDTSTKNLEKIISEVNIWKDLDHPNIVKYYTSFMEREKNVYIVMELVEGVSLSEYVMNLKEKGVMAKEKEVIKLLIDIVCGLKYLHKEKGVLYRDVNPHNIMIDNNFNVKLADFGLARKIQNFKRENNVISSNGNLNSQMSINSMSKNNFNKLNDSLEDLIELKQEVYISDIGVDKSIVSHSMSNAFIGSILYSSPEMIKNEAYTEKSDLWALGSILYELLNLSPPFEGDNPLTIAKKIADVDYRKLKAEDYENPVLVVIVERCLVLDQNERIDLNELCGYLGPYFADKLNYFKRTEWDLRNENESLNEKLYKLETAFTSNINLNEECNNNGNNINGLNSTKKITNNFNSNYQMSINKTDLFKNSNFKRISDPLTKMLEMIDKIIFLTSEMSLSNLKEEKYIFINKFKRKIFSVNSTGNRSNIIKTEISKLLNFSKETINFELEDRDSTLNLTGMKLDMNVSFKKITYEILYHYIEELLIINKYY